MINDIIVRIKKDERKVWIIDVRPLLMIDVHWKKRKSDKQKHGSTVLINHYPTRLVESSLELELDQNCRTHPLENLEKRVVSKQMISGIKINLVRLKKNSRNTV